uniref:Bestrophin homolog n=1 Tax=Panagrolaimus sp. JU765 TaxID=591449 RepID=A0AC34RNM6_9BILA
MIISVIYRFALDKEHQSTFAKVAAYIDENMDYIPLTFLLGFFVSVIFGRWKDIFSHIGFIDRAAFFVTNYIHANDEEEFIVIKRNILRYLCLTQVMVLRDISVPVRKRFPNMQSVMDAGFLLPNELKSMEKVVTEYPKYWMPINWAISLAIKCRKEGKILADVFLNTTCVEIASFQEHLRILLNYDWVPVPLAYPQVVFLAVRVYFILTLISRQYIIAEDDPHYSK